MSLALSGDTISYLMGLGLDQDQMKGLIDRLNRDALAVAPPGSLSGINEERERLRNESTYAERKRAKDRERQARLREEARQSRDAAATSRDIAGDSPATLGDGRGEPATPLTGAQVVIPSLPSLRSEEVGGVGGVVGCGREPGSDDWPKGRASDHAAMLVSDIASPWLDPSKSPDLVTTRGRLASWRRDGASWEHDVVPVVTALCANRRSKIGTWKFFDQAIARSIAENRQALEIPEAGQARATGPPHSFTDRIAADNAEARRRAFEMLDAQDGPKN